jgi:cytochrome c biogenesis protein CcmG, thiol:disulfide interchange protein DsbE
MRSASLLRIVPSLPLLIGGGILAIGIVLTGCVDRESTGDLDDTASRGADSGPEVDVIAFSEFTGPDVEWEQESEAELHARENYRNRQAPDLVVAEWIGDRPQVDGKFVLVDFWATWCPPCRAGIPELNALAAEYADSLVVIGLSDESASKVKSMSSPKIEYYSAVDPEGRTVRRVGVQGIPHAMLIDPSGKVCWQGTPGNSKDPLNAEVVRDRMARYQ